MQVRLHSSWQGVAPKKYINQKGPNSWQLRLTHKSFDTHKNRKERNFPSKQKALAAYNVFCIKGFGDHTVKYTIAAMLRARVLGATTDEKTKSRSKLNLIKLMSKDRMLDVTADKAGDSVFWTNYTDNLLRKNEPPYVLAKLSTLISALKFAVVTENFDPTPIIYLEAVRDAYRSEGLLYESEKRTVIPKPHEINALLTELHSNYINNPNCRINHALTIYFALFSARRISEILNLTWEQVDLDNSIVTIIPLKKRGKAKRTPINVDLPEKALLFLNKLKAASGVSKGRIFKGKYDAVDTAWQKAKKAVGVTDLHIHDLRSATLSNLAEKGYDIHQLMRVSAHSD